MSTVWWSTESPVGSQLVPRPQPLVREPSPPAHSSVNRLSSSSSAPFDQIVSALGLLRTSRALRQTSICASQPFFSASHHPAPSLLELPQLAWRCVRQFSAEPPNPTHPRDHCPSFPLRVRAHHHQTNKPDTLDKPPTAVRAPNVAQDMNAPRSEYTLLRTWPTLAQARPADNDGQ